MTLIELNIVLYYADYLSLREESIPVTDNCKYYFIYGIPMNSSFILDLEPFYSIENKYYQQAYSEYITIRDKFGDDGVQDFVSAICNLRPLGTINATDMLRCIHHHSYRSERITAMKKLEQWNNNQIYTHIIINNDGDEEIEECTRYIAHVEYKQKKRVGYTQGTSIVVDIQKCDEDSKKE